MRIGHGYDAHRFAENRKLILGGVSIDYELGMQAHSDGDVVIHALIDALLGAAGMGDIGGHFPDTSADYENIDSRILLRDVMAKLKGEGYRVGNADITIIAQAPKMKPQGHHHRRHGLCGSQGRHCHPCCCVAERSQRLIHVCDRITRLCLGQTRGHRPYPRKSRRLSSR